MCTHDTKCRIKISKKSATLICQLCNENKRYQHQTKTQLTAKTVAKKIAKISTNKTQEGTQLSRATPKQTWPTVPTEKKFPKRKLFKIKKSINQNIVPRGI